MVWSAPKSVSGEGYFYALTHTHSQRWFLGVDFQNIYFLLLPGSYRRTRSNLVFIAGSLSLVPEAGGRGATAIMTRRLVQRNGKVPDEWLLSFQGAACPETWGQEREKTFSLYTAKKTRGWPPKKLIVFIGNRIVSVSKFLWRGLSPNRFQAKAVFMPSPISTIRGKK